MFKKSMPCKYPECPLCDMGVPRRVVIPLREKDGIKYISMDEEVAKRLGFIKEKEGEG